MLIFDKGKQQGVEIGKQATMQRKNMHNMLKTIGWKVFNSPQSSSQFLKYSQRAKRFFPLSAVVPQAPSRTAFDGWGLHRNNKQQDGEAAGGRKQSIGLLE